MTGVTVSLLLACPSCPPALEARSLVLSGWFWGYLWIAALPFLVALVLVRWFVGRLDREVRDDTCD
jgi:hypothetical protein